MRLKILSMTMKQLEKKEVDNSKPVATTPLNRKTPNPLWYCVLAKNRLKI